MSKNQTIVDKKPKCDFCDNEAVYDAKTHKGPWAFLCEQHFQEHAIGLGIGKGQKLVLENDIEVKKNVKVDIVEIAEQAVYDGIIECPFCGTSIEPDCKKCPNCGWGNALVDSGMI